MPSFLAHSATSVALAVAYPDKQPGPADRGRAALLWLFAVFVGNFPDLDFIPQLVTGVRFHHGPSHSIVFVAGIGLVAYLLAAVVRSPQPQRIAILSMLLTAGHIALDMLSTGGPGVQLLWPVTQTYLKFPITFFPPVNYGMGLWDPSHVTFLLFESGYAALLAVSLWVWYRRRAPVQAFNSGVGEREDQMTHG